jgi:hypothetical protein
MNSYGFNGTVPAWAAFAEYDYINGEFTGKLFTEQEAGTYKESFINGEIHLGLEPVTK